MLNKELLMVGSESLEPVLSIYISPDISFTPTVSGMLSSGEPLYVSNAGETTFKFSEIELTESIAISYYDDAHLSTSNLMLEDAYYSRRATRAPSIMNKIFRIKDRTQTTSISLA